MPDDKIFPLEFADEKKFREWERKHFPNAVNLIVPAERESAFREAIAKVCADHGAEMVVTDNGKPYGMHSPVLRIELDAIYDGRGNVLSNFSSFDW